MLNTRNNGHAHNGLAQASPHSAAPARDIAVRIELLVPLSGHAGAIGTLELKEALYGDYIDCGPVSHSLAQNIGRADLKIEVVEDPDAVMRWLVRLTGQPEAVLRTMSARDAFAVRREVSRIVAEFEQGNAPPAPTS